ncbi:PleD family two-component system response regulator [Pelagibius sp. Alg239-R121]|uniref:PleD family two-component system response regulator n=1 Tax=Pelagibius sp. Alg239-R121 TaxID=2993448 RepID=UPI0024A681D7|nr:PleD family two-component system response regulator [Pelagibius sp. Alg239-R121]
MTARILVVDDIPANVKLLEAKLMAEYFEVLSASDGPTALEVATSEMPDLVLLDVMMPGMDGFEVCARLKSSPITSHIPVVMVTALSDVSDRVRGLEAGADDFLTKPVNDIALFARVRSLARLKVMMDELRVRQAASGQDPVLEQKKLGSEEETANARILLAETNDLVAEKVVGYLSEAGHTIDRRTSVAEALELGCRESYDLMIVSLFLGDEDGLRLCSQFRTQEETRHVPILLVLEEENLPQLAKGLDLGVTDYLIKPIDSNELRARSRTQIRRRRYHDMLREMLQQSVSLAYTDGLTGVYNRRYMNAHLDRKIMEIAESAKPVSVMLFDIDKFKDVNDTCGHAAGDAILKSLSLRVADSIRDFDLLARYGGEEFVVIMPDTASVIAITIAERVRRRVAEETFQTVELGDPLAVTISIGVATTTDPMEIADSLLARADAALYQAKRSGRNRVVSAQPLTQAEREPVIAQVVPNDQSKVS